MADLLNTSHSLLEGEDDDPVAICGFSIQFPGDSLSVESFWEMMVQNRCSMTRFPSNRFNGNGFHGSTKSPNSIPVQGGHFVKEDMSVFDAEFFNISPAEATSMDPMQRRLLETAFRALENAGMTLDSVSGSSTSVYTGSFGLDYGIQLNRDAECPPLYAGLGFGISMLANRLSWFFNLRGPSIGLDSACSSSAMAIDIAFQALRNKSCDMSMVAGCNLTFAPETYTWLSNMNFLSPQGRCHPFDHRANGYGRGEGFAVMILKRLSDAIRDENTIRAVIRSTLSNEDGRTPGITQPSSLAQQRLIRSTYERAGLSMLPTRYFEAHGTGTAIGDPLEARAIGSAFEDVRSPSDPIIVGAVKGNIGHLEGASGLAGVIKTVLILERGVIPPNANFERLNPKIDASGWGLQFPVKCCPWPTEGLRRASVNSFGYGGANCHIVLDDAYHYMALRSLRGRHSTRIFPPRIGNVCIPMDNEVVVDNRSCTRTTNHPRLVVWSAADRDGVYRISKAYASLREVASLQTHGWKNWLDDLAYTLGSHRTHLQWRSFALLRSPTDLANLDSHMATPVLVHSDRPTRIGFVFSGQGAQWPGMGKQLLHYSIFREHLLNAEKFLKDLGCRWSVIEELTRADETPTADPAEVSQTLCTVLQTGLVALLSGFGIIPSVVIGHSSGEIAAAFAGGHISAESAWKVAYYRGICSAELARKSSSGVSGSMISAGISEEHARSIISSFESQFLAFGATVACINSPENVTLSGEDHIIDQIHAHLRGEGLFSRKLRVPLAYHSRQMEEISQRYEALMSSLSRSEEFTAPMISSVTGERIASERLVDPSYWVLNMVSSVLFSQGISNMCTEHTVNLVKKIDMTHVSSCAVDHLLELGPHAVLQAPIQAILRSHQRVDSIKYDSILRRNHSSMETMLTAVGNLHVRGVKVNLGAVNECHGCHSSSRALLTDLPEYPFNHSRSYWHESRLSHNYRFRSHSPSSLLGTRSRDWNPSDARWRHFIRIVDLPWAEQHHVNGINLYPAAGMIVMAIEAAHQLTRDTMRASGFTLRDVRIDSPMNLSDGSLEVQISLREISPRGSHGPLFQFETRSFAHDRWALNCQGSIFVESSAAESSWNESKTQNQLHIIAQHSSQLYHTCHTRVDSSLMYTYLKEHGLDYGPRFQIAQNQKYDQFGRASAEIVRDAVNDEEKDGTDSKCVIHPIILDAILHLCFTAFTAGGSRPMATSVPSRIDCLWIASKDLTATKRNTLIAHTNVTRSSQRGFSCNGVVLDSTRPGAICMWYEGLELTNLSSVPKSLSLPNPAQFCMNLECKVAIDKLDPPEVYSLLLELSPPQQERPRELFEDLGQLMAMALEDFLSSVDPSTLDQNDPWRGYYWRWAEYHCRRKRQQRRCIETTGFTQGPNAPSLEDLCNRLQDVNHVSKLYVTVARNLISLWKAEVNPLELLMQSGLLKDYYEEVANYACATQISAYMDLLVHQKPGLKILEVGGGTGAGTRNLIRMLCAHPGLTGTLLRCDRYDFTDVSSAFLSHARDEFQTFASQMTFGTLNIEHDFPEQGYRDAEYDVIIASSVLHITHNLKQTLQKVRKALKAGGKLVMQEAFQPDGWTLGFVFGVFPGWWVGSSDDRVLSPNITVDDWDLILKEVGFSGVDLVLRDFDDDVAHTYGWIVSTALGGMPEQAPSDQRKSEVTIAIDTGSQRQNLLATELMTHLQESWDLEVHLLNIAAIESQHENTKRGILLWLADYGPSYLASTTSVTWQTLRVLPQIYDHWLWVTAGGGRDPFPEHGMVDGLARTLRQEYPALHLVTVALDGLDGPAESAAMLLPVMREMTLWVPTRNYEQEYVEIGGRLHTRRLVEANYLKAQMDEKMVPYGVLSRPFHAQVPFKMCSTPDEAYNPYYVPLPPEISAPEGDLVDVAVKAILLRSQDRSHVQGEENSQICGIAFSGVVIEAGREASFLPGDRVFAAHLDSVSSQVRTSSKAMVQISSQDSYADACRLIPPRVAAYTALIDTAHVQPGQSVLVHNGASLTGRAVLELAAAKGVVDLWSTAADEGESRSITRESGLKPERILPASWLESNQMLISPWRHFFDVAISLDSGILGSSILRCVRPGGHYVGRRSPSVASSNLQHAHETPSNVFVSLLPGDEFMREAPVPSRGSLQYGSAVPGSFFPMCLHESYNDLLGSELEAAKERLLHDHECRPIILDFDDSDIIKVREAVPAAQQLKLKSNASYLVCGGLGGLGRDITRWLVSRGARYLILISRSGIRTSEARDLVAELSEKQVQVDVVCCDAADRTSLRSMLAGCSKKMPPIKGCIQAAMVMTESSFGQMDYKSWEDAVSPKVKGSWNLHTELPHDLDFFVMLSSVMGILGTGSLAGYNAGNTYQDSLARYRIAHNERAVSLNLGGVVDGGYLTGLTNFIAGMQRAKEYVPMYIKEIIGLLEIYCDPRTSLSTESIGCHVIVGLRPPGHWKDGDVVPSTMKQPLWGHMHHIPLPPGERQEESEKTRESETGSKNLFNLARELVAYGSFTEAAQVISQALAQQVSTVLGTPRDGIDVQKPMQSYGLDSLSAIDVRNWAGKVLEADLPVFEILGGMSFATAGMSIARRMSQQFETR